MTNMKRIASAAVTAALVAGGGLAIGLSPASAQSEAGQKVVNYPVNKTENNVAIGGYDLVAYFKNKEAVQGSADHAVKYGDTVYHFASKAHQDAFLANPRRYLPRFGGFCPVNMGEGKTQKGNPEHFTVRNGQLYLCASAAAQETFEGEPEAFIAKAEENAPTALREFDKRGKAAQ